LLKTPANPHSHVDTWTAFDNSSNSAVIEAADWLGFNGFAYFEDTVDNDISNGKELFDKAIERTRAAAGGKPIWVTETGWPVSGDTFGQGVASTENAERFWQDVGCPLFGETNVWWYILRYAPTSPNPDFGIIGSDINSGPRFDLSCAAVPTTSSSSASATATTTATVASGTTTVVAPPPGATSTQTEDDYEEPAPTTTTVTAGDDDAVTTTTVVVPTSTNGGQDDDDQDDTPIVPGPPPTTLSSAVAPSAVPTSNETSSTPPQPSTSVVEPGSASAMSFSAAFLAIMLAVAMF
jgi:glucan endo-1,3-beta-D-glucosidase